MSNKHENFAGKVINNTTFAILDIVISKIATTFVFVFLVRLLSESDIAANRNCTGYLVLCAYFDIMPIRVLLRDYPKIANDLYVRDQLLTALFLFLCLQVAGMLLLCYILQSLVLSKLTIPGLSFLFFGMTIDFIALMFQGWIKTVFYTDFQQSLATKISLFFMIARLVCYGTLYFGPSLYYYTWILILTSLINIIMWGILFRHYFRFSLIFNRQSLNLLKLSLSSYGFWDHLNRMVIDTLFTIDAVVLSWFAFIQLQDIGNYTIALRVNSLFFLIPMQLHLSLQVVLSNYNEDKDRIEAINTFIKLNLLIVLSQLVFVYLAGEWLIRLLFGAGISTDVFKYTIIIAIGVTMMNLSWPLLSIINNLCNLRHAFLMVFLPAIIVGISVYIASTFFWGVVGLAYANIFVYSILTLGLITFIAKQYPFPLKFQLLSVIEKGVLHKLLKRSFE